MDRNALIKQLYYQELGRLDVDDAGLKFWSGEGWDDDEARLRAKIRGGAGLQGESVLQPLLADQQYAAFLRKMQFDESSIQSSLQAAQEAAARRIQGQRATYDTQRKQSQLGINSNYEARQNRSGKRLVDIGDARTQIDRSQLQFETGVNEEKAKMERDAATAIADMRRENAEQQVAARDRLTLRSAGV